MQFNIYSGDIATNYSVNITKFGSFEAKSKNDALKIIEVNVKNRYCDYFPLDIKEQIVPKLHNNLKWNLFVCEGEPVKENVIWKSGSKAIIQFFDKKS